MRCAHIPPPCRTMILIMRMLIMMIMMIMMMLKMTTVAVGRNYLFPEKKYNISLHFCRIFEYFECLGTRPGGLSHILSPRLGFFRFLRFDRRETLPPFWPKNDLKSFKNRSQTQQVFRSLFWSTLKPSWSRFGRILRAKMEPKLIQNRSQERSWGKFKNH